MFLTIQINMKEVLHSVKAAMLVTAVVASQLAGCGGGGGGSNVVPSVSTGTSLPAASVSAPAPSVSAPAPSVSAPAPSSPAPAPAPAPATGSFNLSWTAPTTRSDGTPLSLADIDGFRIYYGTSRGNYPNSINVNDGSAQSAVVKDIPVGSYYMVMTTYDVNGLESSYSSAISKAAL